MNSLVDEKAQVLVDAHSSISNLLPIESIREARILANVIERFYGKRVPVMELVRESQIFDKEACRN